jgi:chromosome segregation ATPase
MSLVAPSPERAKELVQAVLSLYDHGFSYPTYKDFAEIRQHYQSKGSEARAAVEKVEAELDVLRKQRDELKEWSDITQETLANLVSQQRLVAVEEAGIKARIAACEKILKEGKGISAAQVQQVETAKTAAEIELVGSAAKRAAIEALVEKGRKRLTLSSSVSMSSSRLNRPKSILKSAEAREAAYKEALDEKMPFAEVEGKIQIRRIRWEQPGAARTSPRPAKPAAPAKPAEK